MENTICVFAALPHQGIDDCPLKKKMELWDQTNWKKKTKVLKMNVPGMQRDQLETEPLVPNGSVSHSHHSNLSLW